MYKRASSLGPVQYPLCAGAWQRGIALVDGGPPLLQAPDTHLFSRRESLPAARRGSLQPHVISVALVYAFQG